MQQQVALWNLNVLFTPSQIPAFRLLVILIIITGEESQTDRVDQQYF